MEDVKRFPLGQLSGEIDIVCIGQPLLELSLIGPVGSLDLPVQSRGSGLDIGVPHSKILDMPMELGLKFMPVVCADRMNPEVDLFHYEIVEVDSAALVVAGIDFQGQDPGGIVDGGLLEPLDCFSLGTNEYQELDVNFHVMPWRLLLGPLGWNSSNGAILWEAIHSDAPMDSGSPLQ